MNGSMSLASLKPYMLPIIAVVVVLLTVPFAILPWVSDLQTDWTKLGQEQALRQKLTDKAVALDKLDDAKNRDTLKNVVEPALPSDADPSGVLGTLEQIAAKAQVKPNGVRFADAGTTTTAAATHSSSDVKTSLTVQGPYANIYNFMVQTENSSRVLSLDTLHIVGASAGATDLVATFDVTAPYLPIPTDLGPIETPLPEMDRSQTALLDRVSKLAKADYAPTPLTNISGKPSPF